jgi:sporulation protein YlmC with PRC-barrel domain
MKMLLTGLVTLLFATPLVASAQTTRPADRPTQRDTTVDRPASREMAGLYEANDIIGTRVKNVEGKDVGEIDQLLIDRSGKVSRVVVGVGGVAGVGEKKVVVPWSELKFSAGTNGRKPTVMIEQAKLEQAPRYERASRSSDAPPAASPRTDSDRDGKSNRSDRAPLDPNKK